jgi:1,3-beta-galactosyl-N-acetylhexosamine phosphorylase
VEGVKYKEGRFLPYFFPDTFFEGNEDNAVAELNNNWITARRAMMRNPLDRIGFGGYLELAAKFPKFIERAGQVCDEFRYIYDTVKTQTPKNFAKVAILNAWGKKRSWMCNMTAHELWYQQSYSYQGIYEALSGLPVEVSFINFDDAKAGKLDEFDVVINAGDAGTAWSGGEFWADEEVVTKVRKFVYNGGGFIGVGEPTALLRNGKFFQLSDVLGVDKECGISLGEDKYNIEKHGEHFILDGIQSPVDYGEDKKNIFALNGTNVVDIVFSDRFTRKVNVGEVKMATNAYGKGRSFYVTGLPYSAENAKLLYRAILWTAGKEDMDKKSYCTNSLTEAHFYGDRYAIINNTDKEQTTLFYNMNGKAEILTLGGNEILWKQM